MVTGTMSKRYRGTVPLTLTSTRRSGWKQAINACRELSGQSLTLVIGAEPPKPLAAILPAGMPPERTR